MTVSFPVMTKMFICIPTSMISLSLLRNYTIFISCKMKEGILSTLDLEFASLLLSQRVGQSCLLHIAI